MIATPQLDSRPALFGARQPMWFGHFAHASRMADDVPRRAGGTNNPAGHVLLALPSHKLRSVVQTALQQDGWAEDEVAEVQPREGRHWLLVKVGSDDDARRVGQHARMYGASSAVRYRALPAQDLL